MRLFLPSRAALDIPRASMAPEPSDHVNTFVLSAGGSGRQEIPEGARFVSFGATGNFFVAFGGADVSASIPSAEVADGSASELNPAARMTPDGATHVSITVPAAATVVLSFYA